MQRLQNGYALVVSSIKDLLNTPILIVPIAISWLVYAAVVVFAKYYYPWQSSSISNRLLTAFILLLILSSVLSIACLILLELLQQKRGGNKISLIKATAKVISKDLYKAAPIITIWAILWFILTLIEVFLSNKNQKSSADFSAEDMAATLANYQQLSFSTAFISLVEKGIRMLVFLIFPAIAWENNNSLAAVKKGLVVLKTSLSQFAAGFALTEAAAIIVFLPASLSLNFAHTYKLVLPSYVWVAVIIYSGLAWSFSMFLEQIFVAKLYWQHMEWEKACIKARASDQALPSHLDFVTKLTD